MPHTTSAEKRLRQSQKRRLHNRELKKELKLQLKAFVAVLKTGSAEEKEAEHRLLVKKLDKAASRRILHPNTASRRKSQMARMLTAKPVIVTKPTRGSK